MDLIFAQLSERAKMFEGHQSEIWIWMLAFAVVGYSWFIRQTDADFWSNSRMQQDIRLFDPPTAQNCRMQANYSTISAPTHPQTNKNRPTSNTQLLAGWFRLFHQLLPVSKAEAF